MFVIVIALTHNVIENSKLKANTDNNIINIYNLFGMSWHEILREKEELFKEHADYSIIKEQYNAYVDNRAPFIAHSVITSIPISENGQELVDIKDQHNPRIEMLPDGPENKPFSKPYYNSGLPSGSKIRADVYKRLEKMVQYLDELAPKFNYKPGMISIKVFEGLRNLKTQEQLFQNKFNEIKKENPEKSNEEIEQETAKWVSPIKNNIPVHSTGAAIDIRLWNAETNNFLDLGKFGVIWGTNNEAETFSENCNDTQKLNRLYMLMTAARAGLTNYSYEYWHFSAGDRYAAYWSKSEAVRIAWYGPID